MLAAIASALHLYGVALMVATFFARAIHLNHLNTATGEAKRAALSKTLFWDSCALGAVVLVMSVGVWRMWLEKGPAYYTQSPAFWAKMIVLGAGWLLELPLMMTLIRWRVQLRADGDASEIDTSNIPRIQRFERAEGAGTIFILFAAALMSRGIGHPTHTPQHTTINEHMARPTRGAPLYQRHCATCHGAHGQGITGIGTPNLCAPGSPLQRKDDAALLQSIAAGIPTRGMPAWRDRLTTTQRRDTLAHMRALCATP